MKSQIVYLFTGLTAVGGLHSCNRQGEEKTFPNIVIIFADDMGFGDVSFFNPNSRINTPAIDDLASNGIAFTDAHSSASVCTPSRYGLLTGRYAFRSASAIRGINGFREVVIEDGRETLASLLKKAGYSTALIGKWHLGVDWVTKDNTGKVVFNNETGYSNVDYRSRLKSGPNDFGFDHSYFHVASTDMPPYMFLQDHNVIDTNIILTNDIYPSRLENTVYDWDLRELTMYDHYWRRGLWWKRGEISESFRIEESLTMIRNQGISFIERQSNNKSSAPFFLYLPLTGPHTPWLAAEEFQNQSVIGDYGDFVLEINDIVLQIKNTLKRHNFLDNTIIIFSSDNGANFLASDIEKTGHESSLRRGRKGDIWDGGHHVPLIIYWPERIKEPAIYEHTISLTDLFATFAELTGQKMSDDSGEDSFSFLHVLDGDIDKPTRDHMVHYSGSTRLFAIRKNGWKYIDGLGSGHFTETESTIIRPEPGGPQGQLYNLEADPLESDNLYLENPSMVENLKKDLQNIKAAEGSR